ncbi:putative calmodulin [Leptomonas pyrrhocoris]|uniref:Putative calmodulin n=1 Tax=Leptomonas pyrrhocoris TaxID=157538 RepID=A0A0N1J4G1_LEPPY|nr:putative calmodulin [Leptomonas pyrrhocoris]XP_015654861.1 putative calmodulin [Leptomonas pyrrhocoris]KPA76421.1 putative calmodulin [Leptomonas pyrrhocoris]KPA76422.1 putative calmodulin [Leptomonas pyrrhocoris]|eukprot:XP_015654860.1 putative calmodulin [Leptomonas pyrrhocoris]
MDDIPENDLQEFKEIFDLVDTDHTGVISVQELRKLMASLHLRPTEQELAELFEEAHAVVAPGTAAAAATPSVSRNPSVVSTSTNSGDNKNSTNSNNSSAGRTINFTQFASMMARRVQSEYSAEQLRNAFQLFESPDMPEGFVSTRVLAHALRTYGSQKPSEAEVERLIAAVDPERRGRINYYDFVDLVTN